MIRGRRRSSRLTTMVGNAASLLMPTLFLLGCRSVSWRGEANAWVLSVSPTRVRASFSASQDESLSPVMAAISDTSESNGSSTRCNLLEKLLEDEVVLDGIAVQRRDYHGHFERTMVAIRDVAEVGTVVLRAPIESCITSSKALGECEAARDAKKVEKELGTVDDDLLALWLLQKEHHAKIRQKETMGPDPYIDSLPTIQEYAHIPLFWNDDDFAWLEGSEIATQCNFRKEREREFHEKLYRQSSAYRSISSASGHHLWMWAKCSVLSRGFLITDPNLRSLEGEDANQLTEGCYIDDDELCAVDDDLCSVRQQTGLEERCHKIPALFPLVDMFNHATKRGSGVNNEEEEEESTGRCTCEWGLERGSGDFVVKTLIPVRKGDQVTISYGSAGNSGLLLNYGFCLSTSNEQEQKHQAASEESRFRLTLDSIRAAHQRFLLEQDTEEQTTADDHDEHYQQAFEHFKRDIWARDEGLYPQFEWRPMERIVRIGVGHVGAALTILSLIRVTVATMEELDQILFLNDDLTDNEGRGTSAATLAREAVSYRNERVTLGTFEYLMQLRLDKYAKLPVSSDSSTLNDNQRNALQAVQSEKMVLKHWRELARFAGFVLEDRRKDFDFGLHYSHHLQDLLETRGDLDDHFQRQSLKP